MYNVKKLKKHEKLRSYKEQYYLSKYDTLLTGLKLSSGRVSCTLTVSASFVSIPCESRDAINTSLLSVKLHWMNSMFMFLFFFLPFEPAFSSQVLALESFTNAFCSCTFLGVQNASEVKNLILNIHIAKHIHSEHILIYTFSDLEGFVFFLTLSGEELSFCVSDCPFNSFIFFSVAYVWEFKMELTASSSYSTVEGRSDIMYTQQKTIISHGKKNSIQQRKCHVPGS